MDKKKLERAKERMLAYTKKANLDFMDRLGDKRPDDHVRLCGKKK